jgi:hypothetical protein
MLITGIAGGTGSGKTTAVRNVKEQFFAEEVSFVYRTFETIRGRYHSTGRNESGCLQYS